MAAGIVLMCANVNAPIQRNVVHIERFPHILQAGGISVLVTRVRNEGEGWSRGSRGVCCSSSRARDPSLLVKKTRGSPKITA